MARSRHSLHSSIDLTPAHRTAIRTAFAELRSHSQEAFAAVPEAAAPASYEFPLSTVSLNLNFDAYITVSFPGAPTGTSASLLVDSGNSMLIVPRWEDIQSIPGYQTTYTVLGASHEPWGCPANVVKGPIELIAANGTPFVIEDCVFYACTGNPAGGSRTANLGTGCLNPWTSSSWNTPLAGVTMQSPLSYSNYPYAEFDYASAGQVMQAGGAGPALAGDSVLRLYAAAPDGYSMFAIIPNCEWMSLAPKSLRIGGTLTQWPGPGAAIAMVDTGGGPVFLSDPDGFVYATHWPDDVANPDWAANSVSCQSTEASVGVELGDSNGSYTYTIDDSTFPPAVQGLTIVMCKQNQYMMGQRGMNIGGISALANYILIDFQNKRIGLKSK
jgi:hypothetical protein